jgi:transcriptional regulator with GAF, ATPase, and Fis domain
LIAKAIHEASTRAGRPFVTVNSSNIPSELLESELFGHTRGAFTGAVAAKKGLFEVADGGSIFPRRDWRHSTRDAGRLLRVIQEREFTPLGDTTPRRVDVRIIARRTSI